MVLKRRLVIIMATILLGGIVTWSILYLLPLNILSIQQKPEQAPQKVHDYYLIIDENSGETLMYVPLVVSIGDEVITEANKRYRIVRVEENRAYARFVEDINIKKYAPPEKSK